MANLHSEDVLVQFLRLQCADFLSIQGLSRGWKIRF